MISIGIAMATLASANQEYVRIGGKKAIVYSSNKVFAMPTNSTKPRPLL